VVLQASIGLRGLPGRIFDSPGLQYIGRISYGLYLVHNWMPDVVDKYFGPMPKYQAAPIVLALTFGVCILSWHFFEKPILGLKRFFWNSKLKEPVAPENEAENDSQSRETARAY
jgi:peptidoglycan/LPS O-acetylase OafA/YrhL